MTSQRWQRIDELFKQAVDLPPADQRRFIKESCEGDAALATVLLDMLSSDRGTSFLDEGAAALAAPTLLDPFGDRIGPYRRKSCLGYGGMGVVYLAEHMEWGTLVAIKVPGDAWISPDRKERFASEQRVLAQLIHPGIARIYEGGTGPNGTPWFAMEYVEGESITDYARTRNLPVRDRIHLFRQACEAVQYAHSQAIIHRDLKPSNIFVTRSGQVKLLDFGIAKQLQEIGAAATRTGAHPLTLAYAAPEQVSANRVSIQSDLYSLGVTLYELLTDRLPFDLTGLTPSQAEQTISTKIPEKASTVSGLRLKKAQWADLDLLILKSIHKDVSKRYRSVDAQIRDIDHFVRQEPLDGRPDSFSYRAGKFLQRHRTAVLVSLSGLLLIASVTSYFTWRLAQARDQALAQANRERQIQQFMTDLFEGNDHLNGPSRDLKVIDVLAAGLSRARRFDNDPLLQADLYNTLGSVYRSLAQFDKSDELFHQALARIEAASGTDTPEYARTLKGLGELEDDRGQYKEAEQTLRRAIHIQQRLSPQEPLVEAQYQVFLAGILIDETHYGDALQLLKKAEMLQSALPDTNYDRLDNLNMQSIAYIQLHRYDDAERLTRYLIATDRKAHPALRPDDANDIINLGQIQEGRRQFAAAAQSYREALRIQQAWLPVGHPEIADTKRLLAQALEEAGNINEATAVARETLADLESAYGSGHRRVAYALRLLGRLAEKQGNFAEARADFTREIAIYKKIGNKDDVPVATTNLADLCMKQNDYRLAERLYDDAVRDFSSAAGATGVMAAHANFSLGKIRAMQGRYKDAEPPLLTSLELCRKQGPPLKAETEDTLTYLAKTYQGLHQPAKADEFSRQLAALQR